MAAPSTARLILNALVHHWRPHNSSMTLGLFAFAIPLGVCCFPASWIAAGLVQFFALVAIKLSVDTYIMMHPPKYVDLTSGDLRADSRQREWPFDQEVRPLTDAILHVILFQWQLLGTKSKSLANLLEALNRGFDEWDVSFADLGKDAEQEVLSYCWRYGIPMPSGCRDWEWSKLPHQYCTMNEWFTRSYRKPIAPSVDERVISAPATAVVTAFASVRDMPKFLKNDSFTIDSVIEDCSQYLPHMCIVHYLASSDYHLYHAPVGGRIVNLDLHCDAPYSVTVKPYVFQYINILERNRRAVVQIERSDGLRVAMVIIGGVTVDSIRLEAGVEQGAMLEKGQLIGAFARGGSSVALFFNRPVHLCQPGLRIHEAGLGFKLACGADLAHA